MPKKVDITLRIAITAILLTLALFSEGFAPVFPALFLFSACVVIANPLFQKVKR